MKTTLSSSAVPAMSAAETAVYLSDQLGGQADRWKLWLQNDRRPGRPHHIPPQPGPGRPRYVRAVVDAYIDEERAKRLTERGPSGRVAEVMQAFGLDQQDGSSTGRRLDCQIMGQLDEATGEGFVQFVVASPLLVYRLGVDQARLIARELLAGADDADQFAARARKGHDEGRP